MSIEVRPVRLLAVVIALASCLAHAGSWVPSGPSGGGQHVATHPLLGGQAMIASEYGSLSTWFTSDGGAHWTGNPWRNANGVLVLAGTPTVAWMASERLMRSVDQGRSWAPVQALAYEHVQQLAANPSNGDEVVVAASNAIWHTKDGGITWIYGSFPGNGDLRAMVVDWSTRELFLTDWNRDPDLEQPLWRRSLDGPEAWNSVEITARSVAAARGIVLCGDAEGRLLRSIDGGATFSPVAQALGSLNIIDIAIAAAPSKRAYALESMGDAVGDGGRLLRSDDEGATWSPGATTPDLSDGHSRIAIDAASPDLLYLAATSRMLGSADGGTSLHALARSSGAPSAAQVVAFDAVDPLRLWSFTPPNERFGADGARSSNGGATWSGIPLDHQVLAASRKRSNTVFGHLAYRHFGTPWSFDVSVDGGNTWTPKILGPALDPGPVRFGPVGHGASPGEIYVAYSAQDSLTNQAVNKTFASTDDGETFKERAAPPFGIRMLASTATPPTVLYAARGPFDHGTAQLWRSTDGALSWQPVYFFPHPWIPNSPDGNEISAIAVDPTDPNRLYAGLSLPDHLMRSVDGGVTWVRATAGLGAGAVTSIVVDPASPSTVYAAQYPSGVFRSTDHGQTWTAVDAGLRDDSVRQVVLDPFHPGRLYAGTDSGLWRVDLSAGLPAGHRRAIEFYHAEFDHYFVSADLDEIAGLDAGVFAGWVRTGEGFRVAEGDTPGNHAVCRFFGTGFAPKSSHFYTPYPAECEIVKGDLNWNYEKIAFGLTLPDPVTRGCPPETRPLYRAWNRNAGGAPNHRYDADFFSMQNSVLRQGWILEGDARTLVFACVPI